ncbi:hypothetical protein ACYCAX_17575 [Pseudomonas sp. MT3]
MNSPEMRVDAWSRVLLAIALLLLLIHQMQQVSPILVDPDVLIPRVSGALPDALRYPQPLPAWDRDHASRRWAAPPLESRAIPRHGGWVF